jgi:beta-glucosidase
MENRTYKYFNGEPLYPFGYGLSYTSFTYSDVNLAKKAKIGDTIEISAKVTNSGNVAGEEVVQLYMKDLIASTPRPKYQLEGFQRIALKPGETKTVKFVLEPRQFSIIGADDKRVIEPGDFSLFVGGSQPEGKGKNGLSRTIELKGNNTFIE